MTFCASSKRADTSDSAKFTDSSLAPWRSFPDAAFSWNAINIWTHPRVDAAWVARGQWTCRSLKLPESCEFFGAICSTPCLFKYSNGTRHSSKSTLPQRQQFGENNSFVCINICRQVILANAEGSLSCISEIISPKAISSSPQRTGLGHWYLEGMLESWLLWDLRKQGAQVSEMTDLAGLKSTIPSVVLLIFLSEIDLSTLASQHQMPGFRTPLLTLFRVLLRMSEHWRLPWGPIGSKFCHHTITSPQSPDPL